MELHMTTRLAGALCAAAIACASSPALAAVGRTPGIAGVSADGEATYTIPLALPPGTNGMTPSISLEYRHRSRNGLLGIGWAIGGLSQIGRCPRTIAQDGLTAPVTRSANDPFCLDGQRLIVTNGVSYGGAGAEYHTEIESFARIRSYTGPGIGPQYFVLEALDGRILEYGATTDSRIDSGGGIANPASIAKVWALNRIRDRAGNVIDFRYFEDISNGSFRITSIQYNSNPAAGVAASHELVFIYENRPSNEVDVGYVAGTRIREVVRLDRIDLLYNGAVLRRYELSYQPALSTGGRSRLASIQECGAGGGDCLAPTTFTWQDGTPGHGAELSFSAPISTATAATDHKMWTMADINGDGRGDPVWVIGTTMSTRALRYRLSQVDGSFGAEVDPGIVAPYGIGSPFDHNGDGRTDLLLLMSEPRQWVVVPGGPAGLGTPIATGITPGPQIPDFRGLDMNGDGLGDLAYSEIPAYTGNSLEVDVYYALPGGGFAPTPVQLYQQANGVGYDTPQGGYFLGRPGQRVDLDGNGAEDLLMDENYTIARISATRAGTEQFDGTFRGITPGDFNGDGCTDLAYQHYTGTLRIRVSGCGIPWSGPELLGPAGVGAFLSTHDWNSDGRDDFMYAGPTNWMVVLSNGDFAGPIIDTGVPHNGSTKLLSFDANGDGQRDMITKTAGQYHLRPRIGSVPDLLLTAGDGFGVTAAFSYLPLTDPGVYIRGSSAVYPDQDMQTAAQVVAELGVTDGAGFGSIANTRYTYEGLRQHLLGRGVLGFTRRTSVNTALGYDTRLEETRRQDYPFTGLPASTTVRDGSGKPLTEIVYDWSALDLGSGMAQRRFPYASGITQRRFGASGSYAGVELASLTRTVAAIDASSGLVTDETTRITETAGGIGAGSSRSRRILHTAVLNDTTNWCLGRPRTTQLTASHTLAGASAVTLNYSQAWDGLNCRPTQQKLEPGSSQWQVTLGVAYDAFGNLSARTVTGIGMSSRTTALDWGTRGQLPVGVTNPLSQTTTLSWEPGLGVLKTLTDPNALSRSWNYDDFGQLTLETHPDRTSTAWTDAPCTNTCDARAKYQLTQREIDDAGVTHATIVADIDQFGRATRIAMPHPGGGTSVHVIDADALGRVVRQYLPFWSGGSPAGYWQYEYDSLSRLASTSLHSADGVIDRSIGLRYDGLAVTRTNALGRESTATHTAWGDVVQVIDAAGNNTQYEYDAFGRLLKIRDALGNVDAAMTYNARGMKTAQTDMDAGTWSFTPNALGEIVSLLDAKSQAFSFVYDRLGRLTSRTAAEGTSKWVWGTSAAAHNIGQIAKVTGPDYSEAYAYDSLGRPLTRTITADATYRYDYAYNSLGLLDSLTYPGTGSGNRFKTGYEYDAGQLIRIKDANAPANSFWRLNAADAAGSVLDETLGASIRVVTGFNPLSRAMDYRQAGINGGAAIQNLGYRWDANDNLISRQDLNRGLTEEFRYDALDRLDDARRNGVINLDLSYDEIGNISWKSDVCASTMPCYAYHASRRHAVIAAGGAAYIYDANGNMVSRDGATISWTSDNLPSVIASANGNSSQFWHGPAGNRWKQLASNAGATETTIYAGELTEKVTSAGVTTWRHYVPAPTGMAAIRLRFGDGTAATRYLSHDQLGSTDRLLNAGGSVLVAESFAPFGQRRGANWSGAPGAADMTAIAANTHDGYTGHEHLDNLNLIHMNGRVYDPRIGRFISADPYVTEPYFGQSLNRYSYVWNNPLAFVDPSGFDPELPCVQNSSGNCVQITVYGLPWTDYARYAGGAGYSQVESASQRDPCGQDSSAYICAMQYGRLDIPVGIVLTAGTQLDSTLSRSPTVDRLQGAAAQLANIAISSSPVTWLFGADPDFEWFAVPDSKAGRAGATAGNLALLVSGFASTARITVNHVPVELARVLRGVRNPSTLGLPEAPDVFVVAAEDIAGLNAAELVQRLTIRPSEVFTVIRFRTPASGVASPVFRSNDGFLQGGLTRGGAREFVIPNGPIPAGARFEVIGP